MSCPFGVSKKRILVTGGAGFIGANFVHYWLKKYVNDEIIVLDALTYCGNLENLALFESYENFKFIRGDIRDQELIEGLMVKLQIDTVVHFAAESHVDRSILKPELFIETNIMGTFRLLEAAKKVWLEREHVVKKHRFHHVSTDEVYGTLSSSEPAFTEDSACAPSSPYSASKAASDHLVKAYHHTYGLNVTTSNCSNNYGPFNFPEKLIPLVITNILQNKKIPIYGDGKQIRDWLYVEDHIYGIDLILKKGRIGENYNIGGNNEWTNIDIVRKISTLVEEEFAHNKELARRFPQAKAAIEQNTESLITFVKDRPGHDRRYAIDATKTNCELGYKPKETFKSGILKTVSWYLKNEEWWQSVMDGSYRNWIKRQYS